MTNDILSLEILVKQYDKLLSQYEITYKNYIESLNNNKYNKLSNYNIIGTRIGSAKTTLYDCRTECSNNNNCIGSSFNKNTKICHLNSNIINMLKNNNYKSSVSTRYIYLKQINKINDKLQQLNNKINLISINTHNNKLINQHNKLLLKRNKINDELNNSIKLDNNQTESLLMINRNKLIYQLLFFTLLILILIFLNF
jgi:hypothetical protein